MAARATLLVGPAHRLELDVLVESRETPPAEAFADEAGTRGEE
jgi:hypothetical protein